VRRLLPALVAAGAVAAACGGSGGSGTPPRRTPPDLAGFLALPVATPTSCPPSVSGSTSGRRSPWVGHVDISVFVSDRASAATVRALGGAIRALPEVAAAYFESKPQAVAEFRRLYTCSAAVAPDQVPASYRVVLAPGTLGRRDDVVRRLARLTGVESVSCDPSSPCTDVTTPTPTGS
jgi:FtsX extracellular domain